MLIETVHDVLKEIEDNQRIETRNQVIENLRQVGLDDFGLVMIGMPNKRYPKISQLLPSMASDQVQIDWTGVAGPPLLAQTNTFVRFLATSYVNLTQKSLADAKILDFGCGYGRVIRSLYYYTAPENIVGVDPWDQSVEQCRMHGIAQGIHQSDYLPTSLPLGSQRFDLIYAFSVFTHLSERAVRQSLATLRNYISDRGVLVITIRPLEYWSYDRYIPAEQKPALELSHRKQGFAFSPHHREKIDGDITYGDTSLSLKWLKENFSNWEFALLDRPMSDPYQIYVALRPKA